VRVRLRRDSGGVTVELRDELLPGELIGGLLTEVLGESDLRVRRLDAIGEEADLAEVRDEAAEHHVAEGLEPRGGEHHLAPLSTRDAVLEALLVELVGHETVAHEERDLERPVLALAALGLRDVMQEVLAQREDAVVNVARLVLDHVLEELL